MFPLSHKTVIVLDHGPAFAATSKDPIDLDSVKSSKSKGGNCVEKSLWTCSVEAALEYHRIVGDLFTGAEEMKLIRFVVSDFVGRFLTTGSWHRIITNEILMESLASLGAPDIEGDPEACCIINGISMAVEALSEVSEGQKTLAKKGTDEHIGNKGRIIIITKLQNDEEMSMIESHVLEQLSSRNKLVSNLDENYLIVDELEVCVLNVFPLNTKTQVSNRPLTKVAHNLWSQCHSICACKALIATVQSVAIKHFDLASTIVTGIPMKEEANAGISVNYDVELFHPREAHFNLERMGLLSALHKSAEGRSYNSLSLNWCTPAAKAGPADLLTQCSCAVRVSPASVNSRPSACLTSFLLSGRSVMLEVPAKRAPNTNIPHNINGKSISHVLICHSSIIFIHSMVLGKSVVEEPPSISEGPGGRVTDYRIAHFGDFMKECLLAPESSQTNNDKAKMHLRQLTKYWPITVSDTIIFSIATRFEPLLSLIKKTELSDADVELCKKTVINLVTMEQSNEPIFTPGSLCSKLKGIKSREEQYRLAFEELEQYVRTYAHLSANHLSVLNSLLTCTGRAREANVSSLGVVDMDISASSSVEADSMPILEDETKKSVDPPAPKKAKVVPNVLQSLQPGEKITLYEIFLRRYNAERWANWKDFDARKEAKSNKVDLYKDLFKAKEEKKNEMDTS